MKEPIAGSTDFPIGNAPPHTQTIPHHSPFQAPICQRWLQRGELWIYDWGLERQSCLLCWNWGQSRGIGERVVEPGGGREGLGFRGPRRGQEPEEANLKDAQASAGSPCKSWPAKLLKHRGLKELLQLRPPSCYSNILTAPSCFLVHSGFRSPALATVKYTEPLSCAFYPWVTTLPSTCCPLTESK